jgi:hypothetical protein
MTIEWLVVRLRDRTWKLWRSEAAGWLLDPAAKEKMSTWPQLLVERQKGCRQWGRGPA